MADNRYTGEQQEEKSSLLGKIAKTGMVAAGGYAAYRNRAAIGREISNIATNSAVTGSRVLSRDGLAYNLLSEARTFGKGLSDALGDNPSVLRLARSTYDKDIGQGMQKAFEQSVRQSIQKRHANRNIPGENKTEVSDWFHKNHVRLKPNGMTNSQFEATKAFRVNEINKTLGESEIIQKKGGDKILQAINDYTRKNESFLNEPENHMNDFMKKMQEGVYGEQKLSFSDDIDKDLFQDKILKTLEEHKSLRNTFEANKSVIQERADAFDAASIFSYVKQHENDPGLIEKQFNKADFQQMTLKNAESLSYEKKRDLGLIIDDVEGKSKPIDITVELRKHLERNRRNGELQGLLDKSGLKFDPDNIIIDRNIYTHRGTGEILDNRHIVKETADAIDVYNESVKIPFLNINGVDLTPWQAMRSGKNKEGLQVLHAGQVHGYIRNLDGQTYEGAAESAQINAIRGGLKNSDHFYTGGNVFRYTEGKGLQMIDEDLYLAPSQYGAFARMHDNQTHYSRREEPDNRGLLKNLFDIGHQEGESRVETYRKAWNKLSDPMYGPNAMKALLYDIETNKGKAVERTKEVYNVMRVGIDNSAEALSRGAAEQLSPAVNKAFAGIEVRGEAFDFSRIADDDYLLDAAIVFNQKLSNQKTNLELYTKQNRATYKEYKDGERVVELATDPAVKELTRYTQKYISDPEGFLNSRSAAVERNLPIDASFIVPSLGENQPLITGTQQLRRAFHQYAMRAVDDDAQNFNQKLVAKGKRVRTSVGILEEAARLKKIDRVEAKNAKDLEVFTDLLSYDNIHTKSREAAEAKTFLNDILAIGDRPAFYNEQGLVYTGNAPAYTAFGAELQAGIRRAQPILGRAPEPGKEALNNADFIVMRKSGLGKSGRRIVNELNVKKIGEYGPIEDAWDLGINAEMYGRNAGKTLLDEAANVTKEMFAGRHRKTDTLENVTTSTGILYGLSERLDNQMGNLALGLSQKHLGSFQSILANQYLRRVAMPVMAYQQAVYFDGLTKDTISDGLADGYVNTHSTIQKIKDVTGINKALRPWQEVFKSSGLDQVGEWMGVKQADFLTFGLLSDFRSAEDVERYYESGEDPVRKNRYWGIGSPSPWAGGGIDHFTPNWYRKAKSDYKFTDTMYGSESEYFANHWMPTLTNPLAPLNHFLLDPYHYENKHKDDRPYAITGGFSSIQNLPIIGPAVDGTVGRILKPRREHEGLDKAHREYISEINEKIKDQYSPYHDGSYVSITPTGDISLMNKFADQGTGELFGGTAPTYGVNAGVVDYGTALGSNTPNANVASGGFQGVSGPGMGTGMGTGIARGVLASQNYQLAVQGDGQEASPVYGLFKEQNKLLPMKVNDIGQVDSIGNNLVDAFYSSSELAGIYGFMTKTTIGYEESWRGTVLAPSSLMTSPSRAFWDMNLGGAGGSLSEIGRRYAPRDPNKNYYSPIRNTMPDWLPGIGEQTDLLHGDPYVKLQKGEIRLPGEAYERLYKLHPDGTGAPGQFENYGVFDRFRILADVAPDSEQYKVAKHQVSLLRQAGGVNEEMDREYDEIIDQVRAKEDTHRWYDKKFSNAKIQEKTVTITQVLDANTFMVDEYDAPIRLAGVKLTEKDNPDAIAWMRQFVDVGEKVKIGIADDPVARYNQDTYGTMSAVVYTNKNEEGRMWFETTKGTSLNSLLANKVWDKKVQTKDNGSPTSTAALYGKDMLTVGKYTEMITHDILPKVPFVGILADKFLQVRTPIESYKREQFYGTDWRPWTQPYEGWIKPMVNTVASSNPLLAGAQMAAIGHLFGKTTKAKGLGRVFGFAIGSGLSSARVLDETGRTLMPFMDKDPWIPKEREKEREINQYFDRLKYVKYRGLYERAAEMANQKEGVDLDLFFDSVEENGEKVKGLKKYVEGQKKRLSLAKKMGYGDPESIGSQIDDINSGLDLLSEGGEAYEAGKYTSLAIKYKQEYESTLYAMADSGATDRTALMRALTPKEREFVPRFMETTNSRERQQILKYVPEDIKRILQNSWGLKAEKTEDISTFFKDHYLPDEGWDGWNASINLDDIKIKVMQKEGLNPTVSGYWGKDQERAERNNAKAIPISGMSHRLDMNRLRSVIEGAGLSNVDVQLTTSYGSGPGGIQTSINLMKDVKNEVIQVMNEERNSIIN